MRTSGRINKLFLKFAEMNNISTEYIRGSALLNDKYQYLMPELTLAQVGHRGDAEEIAEWQFYFLLKAPEFPYRHLDAIVGRSAGPQWFLQ